MMNMVYASVNLLWSTQNWMTDLWIDRMQAPLRHIKGITSGMHSAPGKLWLPFHAPKGCQSTVHYMGLQDIVQLRWSPTCTWSSPPIWFVSKAQLILHVLPNPLCQFCGKPAQGRVGRPIHVLQPCWRGFYPVWHSQRALRIMQELNSAWFQKVKVKAHTSSGNFSMCVCVCVCGIFLDSLHTTRTSEYITVYTHLWWVYCKLKWVHKGM